MAKRDNLLFKALLVVAWLIFTGLCIQTGGLVVNFIFSICRPDYLPRLYQKLDLTDMYRHGRWAFFGMYTFILFISFLKAYLFYIVIRLMHKFDLSKPFNHFVATQITKISACAFSIGIISYIGHQSASNLQHHGYITDTLNPFWADSHAFILMSAIVYIIAVIFKRGIDIQTENDLTI
ncbi:DUF2975 domain-containing protein [Arachidicoccus terrestris]|uniref:DUF2975 domain-containing protein n=1 Tax=Arachidicoccus terrestris TaxID=2875539 RepID=UPI001CC48982|nr:DUF2975 domain-containing protein [Arachidicoccus terrestris]UAY56290.1 DUF2975 domain-containing protein [Arachidicoccus terrestris]